MKTLRRWDKSKKIACFRTIGGHRRFSIKEINRILNRRERDDKALKKSWKKPVLYIAASRPINKVKEAI